MAPGWLLAPLGHTELCVVEKGRRGPVNMGAKTGCPPHPTVRLTPKPEERAPQVNASISESGCLFQYSDNLDLFSDFLPQTELSPDSLRRPPDLPLAHFLTSPCATPSIATRQPARAALSASACLVSCPRGPFSQQQPFLGSFHNWFFLILWLGCPSLA